MFYCCTFGIHCLAQFFCTYTKCKNNQYYCEICCIYIFIESSIQLKLDTVIRQYLFAVFLLNKSMTEDDTWICLSGSTCKINGLGYCLWQCHGFGLIVIQPHRFIMYSYVSHACNHFSLCIISGVCIPFVWHDLQHLYYNLFRLIQPGAASTWLFLQLRTASTMLIYHCKRPNTGDVEGVPEPFDYLYYNSA